MSYEVFERSQLGTRTGKPAFTCFTLDEAMRYAMKASVGTHTKNIWDSKRKSTNSSNWWGNNGSYVDVLIPDSYAVIQRTDGPSVIRGYGTGGRWYDYKPVCKRCNSTGNDPNSPQEFCNSCQGSSYKPKV